MIDYPQNDPPLQGHADRMVEIADAREELMRLQQVTDPRIGLNDDGSLDEFVAFNPQMVHFEAMSDNEWWIGITLDDGTMWHIDCGAVNPRAKAYARAEMR